MEKEIVTGVNFLLEDPLKNAIIFQDNVCPRCSKKMYIVKGVSYSSDMPIRYQCPNCKYMCPIGYDIGEENCSKDSCGNIKRFPSYGQDIYNFISEFGK